MKYCNFLLVLLAIGCSAQSPTTAKGSSAPDDATIRLKRMIRADFNVSPSVDINFGERKPSDFAGYDDLPVTLSNGARSHTYKFLVSKDNQKLMRLETVDDILQKVSLDGRPYRGPKDAKVTIIVFDDFQCPYCATNHAQLFSQTMKEYGDKVRVVYKDYPLFEIHPWAGRAAVDANCLAAQNNDAYWDFADYVHANRQQISGKDRPLDQQFAALDKQATDAGQRHNVNAGQLQECLKKQDNSAVMASVKEGDALGVTGTPAMFINGLKTEGVVPAEEVQAMLDRDLRDAGQTPPVHAEKAPQPAENSKAASPPAKP